MTLFPDKNVKRPGKVIFHIGYHKCGSTYLQKKIFPNISNVEYVDRRLYSNSINDYFNGSFIPILERMGGIARQKKGCNIIFSFEELLGNFHNVGMNGYMTQSLSEQIAKKFPDAEVVVVIRNQLNVLPSLYSQFVKEGGVCGFRRFLDLGSSPWLFRRPAFQLEYLKYDLMIDRLRGIFDNRLHVYLAEDLFDEIEGALDEMLLLFSDSASLKKPVRNNPENKSPSSLELQLMRTLNFIFGGDADPHGPTLDLKGTLNLGPSRVLRQKLVSRAGRYIPKPMRRRTALPINLRRMIELEFGESNKRCSALINKDLSAYGYPII